MTATNVINLAPLTSAEDNQLIQSRILYDEDIFNKTCIDIVGFLETKDEKEIKEQFNSIMDSIEELDYGNVKDERKELNIEKDEKYIENMNKERIEKSEEEKKKIAQLKNELDLCKKIRNLKVKYELVCKEIVEYQRTKDSIE